MRRPPWCCSAANTVRGGGTPRTPTLPASTFARQLKPTLHAARRTPTHFARARRQYKHRIAKRNVVADYATAVWIGVRAKCRQWCRGEATEHTHWLQPAEAHFDKRFIQDIRSANGVLYGTPCCAPVP